MSLNQQSQSYRRYPARESNQPPATPPEQRGRLLATFAQADGSEVRMALQTWEGRSFLRFQGWRSSSTGQWWPIKGTGFSVRLVDLGTLAEAVEAAMKLAGLQPGPGAEEGYGSDDLPAEAVPPKSGRRVA